MGALLGLIGVAMVVGQQSSPAPTCFETLADGKSLVEAPGSPVKVAVGIDVVAIRQIDSAAQTFDLDFYLILRWKDPRLASAVHRELECDLTAGAVALWDPQPELINLRSENSRGPIHLEVSGEGAVERWTRLSGTFDAQFSLVEFPFDTQTLSVHVESSLDRERVVFEPILELSGATEAGKRWNAVMPQWNIGDLRTAESTTYWTGDDEEFSRFTLSVRAERRFGFYVWKVFVPLVLIVMLSWTAFWMSSDHFDGQMAVSITCLLALVAFNFVIGDELPKISYLTTLDGAILIAYVFVFLAALENVVIHQLAKRDQAAKALAVERASRWLFPAAYAIGNVALLIARS
jgi:hypothetical protein